MKMKEWWMRRQVGKRLIVVLMKVLIEWIEMIIFHILVGSKCLSVKYLTSRWISRAPEYEPISPTHLGATERDYWRRNKYSPSCKRGWGASGGWWGGPWSRKYQFSTKYYCQYNQQRIWTWVSSGGGQAAESSSNWSINRWPSARPQVFNSRPVWNEVSGAPGLGDLVHGEEVGVGCWYARSTGGGWNGSWKDFHLGGSSNDMQTADWGGSNGVPLSIL